MTDINRRVPRGRPGSYWLVAGPVVAGVVAILAVMQSSAGAAVATVGLGTAGSFGVLAGSTITNTGASVINGDLGVSPGTAVTGFPPGTVNGTVHQTDGVAAGAEADLTTAYLDAAGRSPTSGVGGFIGAGETLLPGVYQASSSLLVGGTLTLDAKGNADAVFIFQAASTLTTISSTIALTGGAQACNVFWQVGSSATLGTGSAFQGSILALTSITVDTGDTITGRALARNGAVTLDDDTITVPACTTTPPTTGPPTTAPPTTAPPTTAPPTTAPPTTAPPTTAPPTTAPPTTAPPTTAPPTRPAPSPTPTRPAPSPTPTGPSPSPTPTGTSPTPTPTATKPSPAPTPTPITTSIPVTG
jgi:hypothetical protein